MNSNGSQFLLLCDAGDFHTDARDECLWDEQLQVFRLAGAQSARLAGQTLPDALATHANSNPLVQDPHGLLGFLSNDRTKLLCSNDASLDQDQAQPVTAGSIGEFAQSLEDLALEPVQAPGDTRFSDLHLGGDGRAALSFSNAATHGLLVVHLARRWQARCTLVDEAERVWVDHLDRIWVAGSGWLGLCSGEPLPQAYSSDKARRFEPLNSNPHPLRQHWSQTIPTRGDVLAMCADRERLYLLMWRHTDSPRAFEQFILSRSLDEAGDTALVQHALPDELPFVVDLAAMQDQRVALMVPHDPTKPDRLDLPVFYVPDSAQPARLMPERYPQHSQREARFISAVDKAVRHLSLAGPKQLLRLPQARYRADGHATLNRMLDSGTPDTLWHKIYLEACLPPGSHLSIAVKAFEEADSPGHDWQTQQAPLWLPVESELPFYSGFFEPRGNKQGLFEILLQRDDGEVREIRGRYLQIAVQMHGDGRHTPAIHSMRVYYPRLSWQQAFLPPHFHQQKRPDPAQENQAGNGADLRERMLAVAEGLMTPIEEQIAHAEYWAYPRACPSDHLPRLASVLGAELPLHWPEYRQREWLACYGWLSEHRGTLDGLRLALDIATDGGVTRGRVIPVENYRLRRTMATILGLEMDDADHPLTLGTGQSGNSLVGESLILSEDDAREFLALFAPELAQGGVDREALQGLFDNYAYQLSVVLHGPAREQRHTVERVLEREAPAHLQWKLIETDHPFVLGLSPLLGIDTYLQQQPPWRRVLLDDTHLTREGIVQNPVALSPHTADSNLPTTRGEPPR